MLDMYWIMLNDFHFKLLTHSNNGKQNEWVCYVQLLDGPLYLPNVYWRLALLKSDHHFLC